MKGKANERSVTLDARDRDRITRLREALRTGGYEPQRMRPMLRAGFVIQGNSGSEQEKQGRLLFFSANLQEQLLEIKFFGLGIFKLDAEAGEPNATAPARMTAELYCERMEFKYMPSVST